MKTYDQERAEARGWAKSLAASIAECGDAEELLYHLILKRQYDGLNGRTWDASEHLEHERAAARILVGYSEDGLDA